MAAIARVKCDRCGTETNDNTSSMDGWIKVTSNYFYPKQKDDQLSPDLCPSCRKSFLEWIKDLEIGRDTSSVHGTVDYDIKTTIVGERLPADHPSRVGELYSPYGSEAKRVADYYKEDLDAAFPSHATDDFGKPQQLEFGGQDRPSL